MNERMSMFAIEMNDVNKTYDRAAQPALSEVSLRISSGEKIGLIGANGSGKTTLLRLLMNFVLPDKGRIQIWGENNLEKARKYIGFVPERQEGMENFTPRELLHISAQMYGMKGVETKQRIDELLAFAELSKVADDLLSGFSKGMAQRVQICIALIHQPQILLLDEPMSGLDPGGQDDVRNLLFRLPNLTMLYASHNLEEIETFCSSVIIIHRGQIVQKLNLDEIQQEIFTMELHGLEMKLLDGFKELNPKILWRDADKVQLQMISDSDSIQKFIAVLNDRQVGIKRLRSRSVLEDYYHRYVVEVKNG
jgi:ABC-2 type transport system ATP-binding protein